MASPTDANMPPSSVAAYVCPMCPEVAVQPPGPCPKCGMALEPEMPLVATRVEYTCPMHPEIVRPDQGLARSAAWRWSRGPSPRPREENPELRDMTRRFWISVAAYRAAAGDCHGRHAARHAGPEPIAARLAALDRTGPGHPRGLWGGWPFFQRGWASIVNRSTNMFTLIAMGTGVAYVFSVLATVFPQMFPASFQRCNGTAAPPVYFEAAAAIVTLVLLGQVLELRARSRTGAAIRALLDLTPKTARVLRGRRGSRYSAGSGAGRRPAAGASRAKKFRSMEWFSTAAARWMNRCSPANRCRWKNNRAAG